MKNKKQKQEEADIRKKEHISLSPKQKLMKLDLKFGEGKGAKKERAKINSRIAEEHAHQVQTGAIPPGVGFGPQRVPKKKPYQKPKKS